jgi:biotin carboxylase
VAGRAPYPAILKPRRAAGSRHAFKVASERELLAHLEELASDPAEELLLEGYLSDGPPPRGGFEAGYVSVESLTFDGASRHLATNGRLPMVYPLRETGAFIPSTLAGEELTAVLDLATRALRAIGLSWGFSHTEIKLTAEGPAVIEVNGRIGGGVPGMMELVAGVDLVKAAMELALGIDPGLPALPPTEGVAYYITLQPPTDARRILAIDGVDEVRALPGVERMTLKQQLGAELDPANGTTNMILSVLGLAPDHRGFRVMSERVSHDVQVEYEYATGDD